MTTFFGDFDGEFEQFEADSSEESPQQTTFKELVNNCAEEGEEEDEEDAIIGVVSNDSCSSKVDRPTKQKDKRAGRKAKWSEACTDDLVDIICNSEIYQKKLIFTNVKTAKNGGYYEKIIAELKKRCLSRERISHMTLGKQERSSNVVFRNAKKLP